MPKKNKSSKKNKKDALIATGTLRVHPRGFGFLTPDDRKTFPEDIFIPRHLTGRAVDGDHVEVQVDPIPSEKGPEGKVLQILRRSRSHVAGTVTHVLSHGGGLAYVPLLGSKEEMTLLRSPDHVYKVGDRLTLKVISWGNKKKGAVGEMVNMIGHIADPACDIPAAIEEYGIDEEFPAELEEELAAISSKISTVEIKKRKDLRDLLCVTIDPDTAKDFDDAISLSLDKRGIYHLGVHIADVSHYVKPGTLLDKEAKERCNSIYFPGSVVPMLPPYLSNDLCSLKPNVNRLVASVMVDINQEGEVIDYKIYKSVIKSAKRFTYKEAKRILDGELQSEHAPLLHLMVDLCKRLKQQRAKRGSIEFAIPEVKVQVDEKGGPQSIEIIEHDITHQMIEEFMLKANEIVATHLSNEGKPLTYRIHEEPDPEEIKEFSSLARSFGYSLGEAPTPEEFQNFFDEVRSLPYGQFLVTQFIRSMKLASYSAQNVGHYGLALEHYCHFTSPIRRYIDLIVHRVLFNSMDSHEDLEQIALNCSEKERLAAKAEQSVVLIKKLRLLQQAKKKDPHHIYEGIVTYVKPFGFAFEVNDFFIDSFIQVHELPFDYFDIDHTGTKLVGKHNGISFKSGDRIELELKQVDLIHLETKWAILPPQVEKVKKKGKRRGKAK